MNLTGERGHAAGISLAVILMIIGAIICLGAFLLYRRHRRNNQTEEDLLQANEEEIHQLDSDDDTTKSGCNQMRVHIMCARISRYRLCGVLRRCWIIC